MDDIEIYEPLRHSHIIYVNYGFMIDWTKEIIHLRKENQRT